MRREFGEEDTAMIALLGSWAKDKRLREMESYIRRGRSLHAISTDKLVDRWVELIEAWPGIH
ncbi:MAG TPA: hypothetical protein VKA80_10225, partial [Beijerinckiaceae bacterium]|nr:hypothetical protein [Beijerinckiaceae bacterium]